MHKFLYSIVLFLMSCSAFADEPASAPVETVDVIYVVIFLIIFLGSIVGFFIYLWWRGKKEKPDQ